MLPLCHAAPEKKQRSDALLRISGSWFWCQSVLFFQWDSNFNSFCRLAVVFAWKSLIMFQNHNDLQKGDSSVFLLSWWSSLAIFKLCNALLHWPPFKVAIYLSGVLEESIGQLSSLKAQEIPNACFIQRQPNFLQQSPRLCLFSKLLFETSWLA